MTRTENLTVMFTDIVGYTERTSLQSRAQNRAMLDDHNRLLFPLIGYFGGRRVKSIGDALLVTFRSPTDAVHCGMAMHDALAEYNTSRASEDQIHIRVAINVGEVRVDSRDVFGEAVNVASRVEGMTPPDLIYFTEAVYLSMNKAEVPSAPVGKVKLKGIPEEVMLFQVPIRQVNRLVAGGEDLEASTGILLYGGMHRSAEKRPGIPNLLSRVRAVKLPALNGTSTGGRRVRVLAAVLLVVALGAALWSALPVLLPALQQVAAGVPGAVGGELAGDPDDVGSEEMAPSPAPDPRAEQQRLAGDWLARGHAAFEENRRRDAVPGYEQALSLDPALQDDALLARNLVACLSWASDLAIPLIRQYPSAPIIAALAARTAVDDKGGMRAVALLRELGLADRVDPVTVALEDLTAARTCEDKLAVVKRLRVLRSPRSLPALKASVGSGVGDWFRNRCFRSEANHAIEEIKNLDAVSNG
ncbi:adenylate/guanylate cyclase domain-containing protein [Sinimarinibacterium sp. CAU 1509]|uniref:adenylate/guanylate cyclase domain-containing protein n=1 Tax=Sinimarinibacterium sp. CAU 1509 TaxID=2562283 RepID=UPI00146B2BF2|nr:adenylate/guanylate cyclase domain-containing protein [Sinimarinibacterium sp. CAU 1509]